MQLCPLPHVWGGAGRATLGRGQAAAALIKNFTPPMGRTGPLCRAPTSSWVKAQSRLCSQPAGEPRGPHAGPCPRPPVRRTGLNLASEGSSVPGSYLPRQGAPLRASRHQPGLVDPSSRCPFPGLISGRGWRGCGPQTLGFPGRS